MNEQKLLSDWKKEESVAHIHGWDFSHIVGRYTEEMDLPWDYQRIILDYLMPEMKLLDVDTGGGEFLLSLHHPHENTSAAEAYPPNVELCKETLLPLGIDFRVGDGEDILPYEDATFDMVINRHGDFNVKDIHRMLKDGGIFITEQVGAENDRELVELLLGKTELLVSNSATQVLTFWTHRNASDRSNFMMLAHSSGLHALSNGNFPVSPWIVVKTGFFMRRNY